MFSAVENLDSVQDQLATTLAELQITERGLTAAFDQLMEYSSSV